jgi:cell division protein ZipA
MHWNPAIGIPLLIIGLIVLALIWLFGQPRKPEQGRRQPEANHGPRREPTFGDVDSDQPEYDAASDEREPAHEPEQGSLLGASGAASDDPGDTAVPEPPANREPPPASPAAPRPMPSQSGVGQRPERMVVEQIVAVNVVAPEGHWFQGADLIVAADKAGLEFGHKGIFHRMLDGKREQGAVFSVANMLKPGSFDLTQVAQLKTSGLSFFMALPGPSTALDAWDTMLPTAQRMAELLGGMVLDDEHNALGRQRIAHIRDELRAWDRKHQVDFGNQEPGA